MGKVRRNRVKHHLPASVKNEEQHNVTPTISQEDSSKRNVVLPPISENPFSGVSISNLQLHQSLLERPDPAGSASNCRTRSEEHQEERKTTATNKSLLSGNKKERRKQKRENFLKKLETTKKVHEKLKAANKRAAIPVVGDLKPMTLALTDINRILNGDDSVNSLPVKKSKRKRKPRRLRHTSKGIDPLAQYKTIDDKAISKIRSKRAQKHMLYEVQHFQNLISSSAFKSSLKGMLATSGKEQQ